MNHVRHFLYSLTLSDRQHEALVHLVGKPINQIRLAAIENTTDVIPDAEHWVAGIRQALAHQGYQIEPVDLRQQSGWELEAKLIDCDVIWVGGGHTYYLRWIIKNSGADQMITLLVKNGKVYARWSAGAVVFGPTTKYFDKMRGDPRHATEIINEGLHLNARTIILHQDHHDFAAGA